MKTSVLYLINTHVVRSVSSFIDIIRYRDNSPILSVASLQGRVTVQRSGNLILNPVKADDAGTYICEVIYIVNKKDYRNGS